MIIVNKIKSLLKRFKKRKQEDAIIDWHGPGIRCDNNFYKDKEKRRMDNVRRNDKCNNRADKVDAT